MTKEWSHAESGGGEERNLDTRLETFYGPALSEQPLPTSSWLELRSRLDVRRAHHWRMPRRWHFRRFNGRGRVPPFVHDAFEHILFEAGLPFSASMLHCVIGPRTRVPKVHVSLLRRHHICLILPSPLEGSDEPTMLDVLLATGLSRYVTMRKAGYILQRLLLVSAVLFVYAMMILSFWIGDPPYVFLIAVGLCFVFTIGVVWDMGRQRRSMAVRADSLMVLWLGRGRVCRGLHELAGRSRAPSRRRWGDLSFTERIGRICGTYVPLEQERFTLVR